MKTLFKISTASIAAIGFISFVCYLHFYALVSKPSPKSSHVKPEMNAIENAINVYHINTSQYPETLEDLLSPPEGLQELWAGPYLDEKFLYDPWGNMYIYEYGYRLQSYGADGIKGGEGENEDIENFTGFK